MTIYIILYLVIVSLVFLENRAKTIILSGRKIETRKLSFVIIFMFILALGICKSEYLGPDAQNYYSNYFVPAAGMSPFEAVRSYTDTGYILLNWLITHIYCNYWFFTSCVFAIAFGILSFVIYKESSSVAMSFLVYVCLGLLNSDFVHFRFCIAVSIALLGIYALKKEKLVLYAVIIFAASLFHQTALEMLLLYPICIKWKPDMRAAVKFAYIIGSIAAARFFIGLLIRFYMKDDYSDRLFANEGYALLAFYIVMFFVSYLFDKNRKNEKRETQIYREGAYFVIYNQILATGLAILNRMTLYGIAYCMLYFAEINHKTKSKMLYAAAMSVLLGFIYFYQLLESGIVPYISHFG